MGARPVLLVLTSTYPRWRGDPEPGFVHDLCRRLTRRFDVHVLCPHSAGASHHDTDFDGVTVHRYRYAPDVFETLVSGGGILGNLKRSPWKWLLVPLYFIAQLRATMIFVRRLRPCVIHCHWIVLQGVVVAALAAIGLRLAPVLLTSHGGDLYGLRGNLLARVKVWALRRASFVTVVSRAMQAVGESFGVSAERIRVMPMGVDFNERFTPDPQCERDPDELLFVGRLVEKKGLHHLLRVLPELARIRPRLRLTVAGYGPEFQHLGKLARELGVSDRVDFIGAVSQEALPTLYRRAAVFVAPFIEAVSGDREGLGLVLLEAAGCGCPVVVGRVDAVEDVLDPRADEQCLFPPGDEAELVDRIRRALEAPAASRAHALDLRARIQSRFDWDAVANGYGNLLAALAEDRQPGQSDRFR